VPVTFGHCEVACFNTTTTTSARLLLHDLVSSATPAKENQRQNFLFENTRESQQKKRDPDFDQLQSRSLFSPLSSSSFSLACSSVALLLQATLFSSSLLSSVLLLLFSRLQQRSAPPPGHTPPVLGTRERPCPFHPCRGPESWSAFCDRPGPTPPTASSVGGNPGVRECWARPSRPFVTDPSSVTDK